MFSLKQLEYERQLVRAGIAANLISLGISKELISQITNLELVQINQIKLHMTGSDHTTVSLLK
jgi:hypothetical protein